MAHDLRPTAVENPPLSELRTVDGETVIIALSFAEIATAMNGAIQSGAPFVILPRIAGKIIVNIGAIATVTPKLQKGSDDA